MAISTQVATVHQIPSSVWTGAEDPSQEIAQALRAAPSPEIQIVDTPKSPETTANAGFTVDRQQINRTLVTPARLFRTVATSGCSAPSAFSESSRSADTRAPLRCIDPGEGRAPPGCSGSAPDLDAPSQALLSQLQCARSQEAEPWRSPAFSRAIPILLRVVSCSPPASSDSRYATIASRYLP